MNKLILLSIVGCVLQTASLLLGESNTTEINIKGKQIQWLKFESIDSTQLYSKNNIKVDIAKPDRWILVSADVQEKGVGSENKSWISVNRGNVYMTINFPVKANGKSDISLNLENLFTIASYKTIEALLPGNKVSIKYPNDVMVNDKKISGILCECNAIGDDWYQVYVGIGVNLDYSKDDLVKINQPATSVFTVSGKKLNLRTL